MGFIPITDKEVQAYVEFQDMRSIGNLLNRDMHQWWDEYKDMISDYKSRRNETTLCSDHDLLSELLKSIKNKVEKVPYTLCFCSCFSKPVSRRTGMIKVII